MESNIIYGKTGRAVKITNRHIEMLQILREAPEHPGVKYNSKFFENYFHVSNITALRLAQDLRELDLIETKHQQYMIKAKVEEWELFDDDARKQIILIAGIKGLLQQYKDTPLFDNIEKLFYLFEPRIAKSNGLLSSARIAVPPQMEFTINPNNWEKVLKAMELNKKIKARYVAPHIKNKDSQRTLWPYQILLDNGTVYLFAHSEYHDIDLLYNFNKLQGITITNEEFELPEDFDFTKRCKGGRLGAFSSDEVENYEIEVTGYASYWIKDHKLTDDQTFEEVDEEDVIVRFTSCQFAKVMELVLSLGSQAKPLAPKSFVDKWKKEVRKMWENAED